MFTQEYIVTLRKFRNLFVAKSFIYISFVDRGAEENRDEKLEQRIGIKDFELENWDQEKRIKRA